VLGDLHDDLDTTNSSQSYPIYLLSRTSRGGLKGGACSTHQSLDLNGLERRSSRRIVGSVRHLDKNFGGDIHGAARDGERFGATMKGRVVLQGLGTGL
jgi:hypothetical protein